MSNDKVEATVHGAPEVRSLYERIVEYRDDRYSIAVQMDDAASVIEANGHDATPLREGARLFRLIGDDLTKVINGEELGTFAVEGVIPGDPA